MPAWSLCAAANPVALAHRGEVRPPMAAAQSSRLAGPGPRIPAGEDVLRVIQALLELAAGQEPLAAPADRAPGTGPRTPAGEDVLRVIQALLEVAAVKEPLAAAVKRDVRIPPVTELGLAYGYTGVIIAELVKPHALIRVVHPGSSPCCHHAQASFQDETWTNPECTEAISRIGNHTEVSREGKASVASRSAEANGKGDSGAPGDNLVNGGPGEPGRDGDLADVDAAGIGFPDELVALGAGFFAAAFPVGEPRGHVGGHRSISNLAMSIQALTSRRVMARNSASACRTKLPAPATPVASLRDTA